MPWYAWVLIALGALILFGALYSMASGRNSIDVHLNP